jgi:hypothetical protein
MKYHPLPLTRKWRDDYRRWIREGCPTPEQEAAAKTLAPAAPPDLQELVARAGGYHRITAEQMGRVRSADDRLASAAAGLRAAAVASGRPEHSGCPWPAMASRKRFEVPRGWGAV